MNGTEPTKGRDPAIARFAVLQLVRLSGAGLALLGALVAASKVAWLAGVPQQAGYALLTVGLADFFAVPPLLARRWKSQD